MVYRITWGIAVLAALLLPSLARAKVAAHRTACLGNFKQWGLAMKMYVDDNNGSYPPRFPDPAAGAAFPCKPCRTTNWQVYAIPYLSGNTNLTNASGVLVCPADRGIPQEIAADPFNALSTRPPRLSWKLPR